MEKVWRDLWIAVAIWLATEYADTVMGILASAFTEGVLH